MADNTTGAGGPEKLIIIGSGPAGWTAALYAARANLRPLVFAGRPGAHQLPGGQLMWTTDVENFPGYPHGVTGPALMKDLRDQAMRFGTRVATDDGPQDKVEQSGGEDVVYHFQDVQSVDLKRSPFRVTGDDGKVHEAHAVIIATGAKANYLGLEAEQRYYNRGVSACAVCDGALPRFKNRPIAVVGGGDSAVEEATYLTKFAGTVYMVHRRDRLRASQIMQRRALENPKIKVLWNRVVEDIDGNDKDGVTGLKLRDVMTEEPETLEVTGMFLGIGHTPNTAFLQGQLELTDKGYVKRAANFRTTTNVPGVFAAGDVADDNYRQAITAAGTGCMAALDAERYLEERGIG